MDITITDTHGPPRSPSDPRPVQYLAASNIPPFSSSTNLLPWRAADSSYEFGQNLGLFDTPSTVNPLDWTDNVADQYLVADHPLVNNNGGHPSSDYSYPASTRSDSGSQPSQSYTHTPVELRLFDPNEPQWQETPNSYGTHDFPPLQLVDPARSSMYLPGTHHNYLSTSSSAPQNFHLPASVFPSSTSNYPSRPEYHTPPSSAFLAAPSHDLFEDHHFLSPASISPSSSSQPEQQKRYVTVAELTGPSVPDRHHTPRVMGATAPHTEGRGWARARGRGRGRGKGSSRGRGGRHTTLSERRQPHDSSSSLKRRRPSYTPSSSDNATSPSGGHDQGGKEMTPTKRTRGTAIRNGNATATTTSTSSQDEAEYGKDGDGDVYVPSRSVSPDEVSASDYSDSGSFKRRVANKGKDKVPLSAAEALAQMVARYPSDGSMGVGVGNGRRMGGEIGPDDNGPWQGVPLDASTPTSSTARGRKNGTISLPVPVPHLTKKSRGRKVPYVDVRAARGSTSAGGEDGDSDGAREGVDGMSSRSRRGGRGNASGNGGRTFVCEVPGCGKCFVRGEHLKRHVRSIHTHDKPHPCPYEGCNKSFSRRDNLGQHVRLHMAGSS